MKDLASATKAQGSAREAAFIRFLSHRHLPLHTACIALILGLPCLFLGFYLDDYIGRYVYSNLEGARTLYRILLGGYAIANGNPLDNHWQVEAGYAPWWIYPELLLRMLRPLSGVTHWIDAWFWPNTAALQHAQSLVWLFALVFAAAIMYRSVLGPLIGGLAALLFAIDHTHGFIVGYICNRHALVTALFGVLCLDQHLRFRKGALYAGFWALLSYIIALCAGESAIAVAAYLFAYELFAERGPLLRRALAFAPYALISVGWRAVYNALGYGARGSGLYIDPGREPARFLAALLERGPVLLFGQFMPLPAEVYTLVSTGWARVILALSVLFLLAFVAALVPLLKRNRLSRFWAAGMTLALIPGASAHPHNRQLLFASFGAMALIAQLWELYARQLNVRQLSGGMLASARLSAFVFGFHLLASPIASPIATCGIALSAPLHRGIETVGDEVANRDLVFLSAPDYFAVKIVQLAKRVDRRPLPRRIRTLSYGPQLVHVQRTDDHTLLLDYEGGILQGSFMELYRDRRLPTPPGYRVDLDGLAIQVREVTADGRAKRVSFAFDRSLDDPRFRFYSWREGGFAPFQIPSIGSSKAVPPAGFEIGLH